MSTCETTSKLGMAAMLGRRGSVSERPKETVCKTVAEATMVRTHPGPRAVKGPGQAACAPTRAFSLHSFVPRYQGSILFCFEDCVPFDALALFFDCLFWL